MSVGAPRSTDSHCGSLPWPSQRVVMLPSNAFAALLPDCVEEALAVFRQSLKRGAEAEKSWQSLMADYREKFASPYVAAERGYIDDVIEPKETRPRLINALEMLSNKRDSNPAKKHGNIPL